MLTDDEIRDRVEAYRRNGNNGQATARELGMEHSALRYTLKIAARRGLLLDHAPAMPGFEITKVSTNPSGGQTITQVQAAEERQPFEMPETHFLGKMTVNRDAEGRVIQDWIRAEPDAQARKAAAEAMIAGFCSELPKAEPVLFNVVGDADKLNQFTVTDYHFGMLAWGEETAGADWDLKIAEKLWMDWFAAAVKQAPAAHTAVLAQLGDLLHFDSLKAITPAHGNVLDADSRFAKIVRVAIRCLRYAIRLLLTTHEHVHLIFADANHDEASEVWMRETFAAVYDEEPRITVDRSPGTYYAYEWGLTSLFYHHGHKSKIKDLAGTLVSRFRDMFGHTKFSYAHTGHFHSDELFQDKTGIKVERHETLASPSTFEANGGYTSGRSAKVITYSKRWGEVGRVTLTPEMVQQ